jgi:hypothetical protein
MHRFCEQWPDLFILFLPGSYEQELGCLGNGRLQIRDASSLEQQVWNSIYIPTIPFSPIRNIWKWTGRLYLENFIDSIPSSFRLIELPLNTGNFNPSHSIKRANYILDLSKSYEEIHQHYRENHQRNIKRAQQLGCTAQKSVGIEKVIDLAWSQMRTHSNETKENRRRFSGLFEQLKNKNQADTYGIFSPKQELVASCVFFFSHGRAYYILVGNHPNGRTIGASHALIDAFTKDNAGKKLVLDFEGSDLRNLAFFYSGFGAEMVTYPWIRINRLPFYLRWMKG